MKKLVFLRHKENGLINAFGEDLYNEFFKHRDTTELVGVAETPEQRKHLWDLREKNNRAIKEQRT